MDNGTKRSIAVMLTERGAVAVAERASGGSGVLEPNDQSTDDNVLRHILPAQQLVRIPIDQIVTASEGQARQDFNEERLRALAESLKRSGVREPIIVTPHGAEAGKFQIVAGERRWRAAQLAGLLEVPCIVDPTLVDRRDKVLAQAEENLHRENLNPVEEAAVLAQLMAERKIDVKEAGELIGKPPRQARRLLQLHSAAAPIKRAIVRGQVESRAALEFVRIHNQFVREDPSPGGGLALRRIDRLIERFLTEGWNMRRLERFASKPGQGDDEAGDAEVPAAGTETAATRRRAKKPNDAKDAPDGQASSVPAPVVVRTGSKIAIDVGRIERREINPAEREHLINLFEELLMKTRRA